MKTAFYSMLIVGSFVASTNAAILTPDGLDRPDTITGFMVGANTYDVSFTYDSPGAIKVAELADLGDLSVADVDAAVSVLHGLLDGVLEPDGSVIPFVVHFAIPLTPVVPGPPVEYTSYGSVGNTFGGTSWDSSTSDITPLGDNISPSIGVVTFSSVSASSVPEPSSLALLAMATCGGVLVYRKNRKADQVEA